MGNTTHYHKHVDRIPQLQKILSGMHIWFAWILIRHLHFHLISALCFQCRVPLCLVASLVVSLCSLHHVTDFMFLHTRTIEAATAFILKGYLFVANLTWNRRIFQILFTNTKSFELPEAGYKAETPEKTRVLLLFFAFWFLLKRYTVRIRDRDDDVSCVVFSFGRILYPCIFSPVRERCISLVLVPTESRIRNELG